MKRTKKIILGLGLAMLGIACNKDDAPKTPKPDTVDNPDPKPEPENQAPGAFQLLEVDGETAVDVLPTLSWEQATDPDGDEVVYDLYLDTAESPKTLVAENLGTTSYELSDRLEYESEYFWKVVAKDDKGARTESGARSFVTRKIAIEWQLNLGGSGDDKLRSIQSTSDGGFIAAGSSVSDDGDVGGNNGNEDFWVVRITSQGSLVWATDLGGSKIDVANAVQQTLDGGFIVVGYSSSSDGDASENQGASDSWIVKLDTNGALLWQTSLGGSNYDSARDVLPTPDGGYWVVSNSPSNDGNISGAKGSSDVWVVKLDADGKLLTEISLGGTKHDTPSDLFPTDNGNFVIAGYSNSSDGDVTGNNGASDAWIVKLNSMGILVWETNLGSSATDTAYAIDRAFDGGYVLAGLSGAADGDVSENNGDDDYWVVRLDSNGNTIWETSLGGMDTDEAWAVRQVADGGFTVAGYTKSSNGDVSENNGKNDYWIVKLNADGKLLWETNLGGSGSDATTSMAIAADGGVVVAGYSSSSDGDVIGNHGGSDFWIVKLN